MINKIKNNYLYVLEYLLLFIFVLFIAKSNNSLFVGKINGYFIFNVILVLILSFFFFFFLHKKENIKIEKLFLLIILLIGPLYLLFFPVNSLPDEATHSFRIYEIANGNLISKKYNKVVSGRRMDKNISSAVYNNKTYNKYLSNIKIKSSKDKKIYQFNNTSLYSFVCYLPQVTGVLFSKIFTSSIVVQLVFSKIFNFIVYVLFMYFAIKFLPIKKEILLLIGLLPLSVQEAVSLSPDSLTIASSALLVSYILYLRSSKEKEIKKNNLIVLGVLSFIVSQCKIVYLPLCLLSFLIPNNKFKNIKHKYKSLILIILIVSIVSLLWLKIAGQFLPSSGGSIDSAKQLNNIITNPVKYIYVLFYTFNVGFIDYIFQAFGSSLGTLNINISNILVFANILIYVILSMCDDGTVVKKISGYNKWFILLIVIGVILLMCTSLYIQWTPVNNFEVLGIQGRYLIPILFVSSLLFINNNIVVKKNMFNKYIKLFIVMEHLCVISTIMYHFI